jgi:hypothetical protein
MVLRFSFLPPLPSSNLPFSPSPYPNRPR